MFGAGWTEMLIIGIVALVVIGPKDLPIVMRKVGRVVGTIRRMGSEFQREINKTTGLDQITDLRRSITEPLRQTSEDIAKEFNRMTPTGVEPTGIMKPLDPKVESVYEQIAATSGVTTPVVAPAAPIVSAAEAAILPGPAEAAVASKPRRAAKPKSADKAAPALIEKPVKKAAAKPAVAKAATVTPASPDVSAPAKVNAPPETIAPAKPVAARKPSTAKVAAAASSSAVAAAAAPAPVKAAHTRAKKA
jgi:sec-independent protein translocase protein TatB